MKKNTFTHEKCNFLLLRLRLDKHILLHNFIFFEKHFLESNLFTTNEKKNKINDF